MFTRNVPKIRELTEGQSKQVIHYRNKWERLALFSGATNRSVERDTIQFAYSSLNLPPPQILFRASPCAAVEVLLSHKLKNPLTKTFDVFYKQVLLRQIASQLEPELYHDLERQFSYSLRRLYIQPLERANHQLLYPMSRVLRRQQRNKITSCIQPELWALNGAILDFCFSILHFEHDDIVRWQGFARLAQTCGWIYPYRQTCIVCDRPTTIHFHPDSTLCSKILTIAYSDGYAVRGIYDYSLGYFRVISS
jgi:hypothetical protein